MGDIGQVQQYETDQTDDKPKRLRGFAAMDRALVSEIARKGGKAAHVAGTAHEFTSSEAREAGRKGGKATHRNRARAKVIGSIHSAPLLQRDGKPYPVDDLDENLGDGT
jgi:general stress protein YciG